MASILKGTIADPYTFMKFKPLKTISRTEVLLLGLTLVTALMMAWQHWGMNSRLIIEPSHGFHAWAANDGAAKGNSEVSFSEDDAYHLHCKLNYSIRYPHCSLLIELNSQAGLNLTQYDDLHITLKQRSNPRDSIQVYLKQLSSKSDIETPSNQTSVNLLVFNPSPTLKEYILPLKNFYVPSWWVYMSNLPHETPGPDLTQINYLVITTGDNDQERSIDIDITAIEFSGKWISAADLYKALLISWILIFAVFFMYQLVQLHLESSEQKMAALELEEINETLNNRRQHLEAITIYDQATGLLNHRGMYELLQTGIRELPTNTHHFLWLIKFKNIKEIAARLEYENTDPILSSLAQQLVSFVSSRGTVAIWSASELLVFFENTQKEIITPLAEHVLTELTKTNYLHQHAIQCDIGQIEIVQQALDITISMLENRLNKTPKTKNTLSIIRTDDLD